MCQDGRVEMRMETTGRKELLRRTGSRCADHTDGTPFSSNFHSVLFHREGRKLACERLGMNWVVESLASELPTPIKRRNFDPGDLGVYQHAESIAHVSE